MNELGARVRLVKGAYKEPRDGRVSSRRPTWTPRSSR